MATAFDLPSLLDHGTTPRLRWANEAIAERHDESGRIGRLRE